MATRNKSEFRPFRIALLGTNQASMDAYQAMLGRISALEAMVERGDAPDNYTADTIAIVGANRYKTHIFELTTNFTTGLYTFEFLETVPTVDDANFGGGGGSGE